MVIREMTEDECRQALARANFGRLGCARDNQPYVVPISFAYDGRDVYGFSTPGQKIEWMRVNPLVCLEVDERVSIEQWSSVVVFGRYQELTDAPELVTDRILAETALRRNGAWWDYTKIPSAEWRRKSGTFTAIFYRIIIEGLTGHEATPSKAS